MINKLLTACLVLLSFFTQAQNITNKKLDSIMQLVHQRGIFNGNILIAKGEQITYERSLGYADGTKKKLLTKDYKFDIGSVSKEFNGTAILLMHQDGRLNLTDPVSKFLPELGDWADSVQVQHLINYTSGIPAFEATAQEGDSLIYANLKGLKKLKFQPGVAYLYNHYNVFLQMRIVEKVSGLSYKDFLVSRIFKPCKMTGAGVDIPVTSKQMAKAFDQDFNHMPYAQAMTGWVRLTARDLFQWSNCLLNHQIVNKASFMTLAKRFPSGESSIGTTGFRGDTLIWHRHQGSNSNYEALLFTDVEKDVTVVMMTNNQQMKVDGIKNAIFAALEGKPIIVPKKSVYLEIRDKALADVDKGLKYYEELKATQQDNYDFSFEIGDLISTGKYLLRRNKNDEAIKLFQTAVAIKAKPQDVSYGYELIGEAYLKKQDKAQATANYQKAVDVDPNNKNAKGMLLELTR